MNYNTKAKKLILDTLNENSSKSLSAMEIKNILIDKISKATLYRLLDILSKENIINKFYNEQLNCYQYQIVLNNECHHHLHLKCDLCGKILHLTDYKLNIENNFLIDFSHSIIHGTCKNCLQRN